MADLADGAAVLVDPTDVEAIRDGIARATPPTPRRFATWDEVAARTLEVYTEATA